MSGRGKRDSGHFGGVESVDEVDDSTIEMKDLEKPAVEGDAKHKVKKSHTMERLHRGWDAVHEKAERFAQLAEEEVEKAQEIRESRKRAKFLKARMKQTNFESLDYSQIYNKAFKEELYKSFQNPVSDLGWLRWLLSCLIGIIIGLIAFICKVSVEALLELKFELVEDVFEEAHHAPAFFLFLTFNLVLVAIGGWFGIFFEPTCAGSGIPEVKALLNGTRVPKAFRLRTLIGKVVGMICAVAGNLNVGAEGPFIHVGAIVGNGISQAQSKELSFRIPFMKAFRNDKDKRDFISSGAGAGIASAFGAPLGGALFSLEEVSSFWSNMLTWRTFFCTMSAVYVMKLLLSLQQQNLTDNGFIIFNIGSTEGYLLPEIFPFLLMGLFAGLLGALFTKGNVAISIFRREKINAKPWRRISELLLICFVTSLLEFVIPFAFPCVPVEQAGGLKEEILRRHYCEEGYYNEFASLYFTSNEGAIHNLLLFKTPERFGAVAPFIHFLCYFTMACYTAGSGISSGLFVPMVVIGSSYGRFVGKIVEAIYPYSSFDPAKYALMGTAAFMGGLSRMTLSLTVILVECTGDLQYLLPMMLTIMVAKWVGDSLTHPIFDALLHVKYIPYLEPSPIKEMRLIVCKHVMEKNVRVLPGTCTVRQMYDTLKDCKHNGFPVVNNMEEKVFLGLVLRSQLVMILQEQAHASTESTHKDYVAKLAWKLPDVSALKISPADMDMEIDLTRTMNITQLVVRETFSVWEAFQVFRTMGLRHLPVVDDHNRVKGMITKKDLLEEVCEEKYEELNYLHKFDIEIDPDKEIDTNVAQRRENLLKQRLSPMRSDDRAGLRDNDSLSGENEDSNV